MSALLMITTLILKKHGVKSGEHAHIFSRVLTEFARRCSPAQEGTQ